MQSGVQSGNSRMGSSITRTSSMFLMTQSSDGGLWSIIAPELLDMQGDKRLGTHVMKLLVAKNVQIHKCVLQYM